jgi:NAD(P) transhydrogenase subunit alpha
VRSATKEQIQSLGAKPIFVENVQGIEGEGSGGYATEMSPEYQAAQAELVSAHIAKQDIVITTALIPGRPAPRLISDAQIATMRPGSVIVDLAAESGGNVEGAVAGEVVERHGVKIVGHRNVPRRWPPTLRALRPQPVQFPVRLLGQGSGPPGARRRNRRRDPPDQGGKIVNARLLVMIPRR